MMAKPGLGRGSSEAARKVPSLCPAPPGLIPACAQPQGWGHVGAAEAWNGGSLLPVRGPGSPRLPVVSVGVLQPLPPPAELPAQRPWRV